MHYVHRYGALIAALALAACGGGSGATPSLPAVTAPPGGGSSAAPAPTPTATAGPSSSATISAQAGGTVSVTSGTSTLTLTIPAGALNQDATVRLGLYPAGGAPKSSSTKTRQSLPSGAHVLSSFWIDLGGARLLTPLTVALAGVSAAPAGVGIRLAKYNLSVETYYDVDTGEVKSGALVNDNARGYVGISSGSGPSDAYEFYAAPSSALSPPSAIQLQLAPVASSGPYTPGGIGQFTVSGQDAHGNAYAFTPRFAIDNSSVGTVSSATDPYTAVVTFGNSFVPANLTATDAATGVSTSISIALTSQHPVTGGSTFAYAGTLTQNTVRNITPVETPAPTAIPSIPPSNITATVTQNVTVTPNQNYNGISNLYDITTSETRSTQLQSSTSTTHAYYGFKANGNETDFLLYGTDWADDNHNTLSYQYPTAQKIDRLPEKSGDTWTNSPAMNYYENDSVDSTGAAFVSTGVELDDASYTEKVDYPDGYIQPGAAIEADIVQNNDGSGSYVAPFMGGSPYGFQTVIYSSPNLVNPRTLQYTTSATLYQYPNAQPGAASPYMTIPLNVWYTVGQPLLSDSLVNNGPTTIPASCNAASAFGTTANQLVRTIERFDTVIGYHELQTTTSYTVAGLGTVCMQMHDVLQDYYDFNFDFAYYDVAQIFSAQPYQTTTTDETLALQQSGTMILPDAKTRNAVVAAGPALFVAPSNASFLRVVKHARMQKGRAH